MKAEISEYDAGALLYCSAEDREDARGILNWSVDSPQPASSGAEARRMNEYNTHFRWADRIIQLSRRYGIKQGSVAL